MRLGRGLFIEVDWSKVVGENNPLQTHPLGRVNCVQLPLVIASEIDSECQTSNFCLVSTKINEEKNFWWLRRKFIRLQICIYSRGREIASFVVMFHDCQAMDGRKVLGALSTMRCVHVSYSPGGALIPWYGPLSATWNTSCPCLPSTRLLAVVDMGICWTNMRLSARTCKYDFGQLIVLVKLECQEVVEAGGGIFERERWFNQSRTLLTFAGLCLINIVCSSRNFWLNSICGAST